MSFIRFLSITSLFVLLASCRHMKDIGTFNSSCIAKYIDSNKNDPKWPVGRVEEYEFQGKLVYAFTPPSNYADFTTQIKAADCTDMCSIGGFAGRRNSNCNGDNFFEKAVYKRVVWSRQ